MKSIRSLYKIGFGPSSSHTIGPYNAARLILKRYPSAVKIKTVLYGSLAETGKGHGIEGALRRVFPEIEIEFDPQTKDLPHPNTMRFIIEDGLHEPESLRIFSIGGGQILVEGETTTPDPDIYPEKNFTEIIHYCEENHLSLADYVYSHEDQTGQTGEFKQYLTSIWNAMKDSIERGLNTEGYLPGGLQIERKAKLLFGMRCYNEGSDTAQERTIASYSYAVSEENACSGTIVTAPTCGSAGVIPAVFFYMLKDRGYPENEILDALAVAGIVGNVIRTNASISGAECGCQAEIGAACSMAAAGLASLEKMSIMQIEYAAEVAMEHHLGLTCDPINGLVQIPCIERNAVAAMRALNSVNLARFLFSTRKISLDTVIETMYRTGKDMLEKYRETADGGLASLYHNTSR